MFSRYFPYFRPVKWLIPAVHLAVYRATNGRYASKLKDQWMLLLTTTGRRTGKKYTVPLLYVPDGDDFILIGSNWAGERPPLWVANVLADPKPRVQAGRRKTKVAAHLAQGEERARAWSLVTKQYPPYVNYAKRLEGVREIPLVILTPA